MSDNNLKVAEHIYQDRTEDDVKALADTFQRSPIRNYVAPPAPGFDQHGFWHIFGTGHRSGYATHAMSLQWMLSKGLQIKTQIAPHRSMSIDIERFPPDRYDFLFEGVKEGVGHPHAVFCSFPIEVAAEMENTGPSLVPYCAFEGDRVSKYARDLAEGPIFSKVWVVSQFVKDAFIAGGVSEDRVDVVRPMLTDGPWQMTPIDKLMAAKARPITMEDPYLFGTLGTWQERKGIFNLLRAYFREFKRDEPVALVIRTSPLNERMTIQSFKEQVTKEIAEIAKEFGDDDFPRSRKMPRLILELGTDLSDQEVVDWLGTLDCYANPSYGEGLGIPHMWAKAQGVPMVSSTYGAVGQYLTEMTDAGVETKDRMFEHRLLPVDPTMLRLNLAFERGTCWGHYNDQRLADCMRHVLVRAGRSVDVSAAEYTRAAFGLATVDSLREKLRAVVVYPEGMETWVA